MTNGRPTTFTPALGELICSLMTEGKSVRKICSLDTFPSASTVHLWVLKGTIGEEPYVNFSEQYDKACEMRTEYWGEEIIDISDDDSQDELFTEDGRRVLNSEFLQRSKLKIDTRKWMMGKHNRKKYGEKIDSTNTSTNTNTNLNLNADVQLSEADIAILKRFEFDA